jgi:ABC-type bacteriocin/lantibiotic exporter with double-glycine peptidase domain
MDEATSALDNVTEHEVMQAVNGLRGSKTMVIVAHRLSTLQECDLVIELVGGRVVRSGSFAQMTGVHREPAKDASA